MLHANHTLLMCSSYLDATEQSEVSSRQRLHQYPEPHVIKYEKHSGWLIANGGYSINLGIINVS